VLGGGGGASPPSFASLKDKLYASPVKGEEKHHRKRKV
jgi:hypothetical protein